MSSGSYRYLQSFGFFFLEVWEQFLYVTETQCPFTLSDKYSPPHQLFNDAIKLAVAYKQNSGDFMDEVMRELEVRKALLTALLLRAALGQNFVGMGRFAL